MRKVPLLFFFKVPLDWLMLVFSGIFVYWLRFFLLKDFFPVVFEIKFIDYFLIIFSASFIWLGLFALSGLYRTRRLHFSQEVLKVFLVCTIGILLVLLTSFFRRELIPSRFIIVSVWFFSIFFVCLGRLIIHYFQNLRFSQGKDLEPIVVIGKTDIGEKLVKLLKENPNLGYKVIDYLSSEKELQEKWRHRAREISQIIQADPSFEFNELRKIIDFCVDNQIIFQYIPNLFRLSTSKINLNFLSGIPVMEFVETSLVGWNRFLKDIFDFIAASILVVLLSPVFLVVPLIIKLDSPGPAFVRLERIGERGKVFKLWKFRSMIKDAHKLKEKLAKFNERKGPLFKMKNDPRITRVGKILRRTSIDELPQLFNVLRGEMSLIGPRPHEPNEVARYQIWHKRLLNIKPGITGLAQISGRSDLSFDEEARLDIYYLQNWSFILDLEILIKTIPAVLRPAP